MSFAGRAAATASRRCASAWARGSRRSSSASIADGSRHVHELDRRRPEVRIEYHFSPEPEGRVHVGPVWYDPPVTPGGQWWILQDLHGLLGGETNNGAERRLRREIERRDGSLLDRLSFDTEAG